jgi:pimeloyl-ACP methyl ester carboxylesterase
MKVLLAILLNFLLAGVYAQSEQCLVDRYADVALFDSSEVVVYENIMYGNATNLFNNVDTDLYVDVWCPDPSIDELEARPLVVLIHGGSFQGGSRDDMNFYCMELARRGFVAATVSYRLGWGCDPNAGVLTCLACGPLANNLPTAAYNAVQDAHAAVRYLVVNAAQYGIDQNWVFTGGVSAGAITALGLAFTSQQDANTYLPVPVAAAGNIAESGNELVADFSIKGVMNNCGAVFNTAMISAGEDIPVISFHDDGDCVVPYGNGRVLSCLGCTAFPFVSGSSIINNHLNSLGICSELNTRQLSLLHCGWPTMNAIKRTSCFFKRIMCGVCTSSGNSDINVSSPCSVLGIEEQVTCASDLNGDGLVNSGDLLILLSEYGTSCQ